MEVVGIKIIFNLKELH